MINKLINKIRRSFQVQILQSEKKEFYDSLYKINLTRSQIIAVTFMVVEVIMIIVSSLVKKNAFFQKPEIYYLEMYILMIAVNAAALLIFTFWEDKISSNIVIRNITEIVYCCFLLSWCAVISLLDQLNNEEIIVYMMAAIAVAVTPIYRPPVAFGIYFFVESIFLVLLPYFCTSADRQFSDLVNSTEIVFICWVISFMRYKNRAEDFVNRKKLKETTNELKRLNKELEEANHKLEILSQTDGLTGIYNRSMFDKILKKEWKRCKKHQKPIALIMIDIDFFKSFNDNYGHQAGDICLKQVAEVLSECTERMNDFVVRYGGEEFAIILPDMDKESALELAHKMRNSVENMNIQHDYSSVSDYVTISLGVYAVVPDEKLTIEEFIRNADMALYKAKNTNRNRVVVA